MLGGEGRELYYFDILEFCFCIDLFPSFLCEGMQGSWKNVCKRMNTAIYYTFTSTTVLLVPVENWGIIQFFGVGKWLSRV